MINKKLKFCHLADLHLGAYREKIMTELNFKTFQKAVLEIIESKSDFVLFSGDIFNSPMPNIEIVNNFAKEIIKLKENNIKIFVIGGSHDYSNSGKSYIELLNTTGLIKNISKYEISENGKIELIPEIDEELKITITGLVGKKSGLDKSIYQKIQKKTLDNNYFNIFMFHTTIDDLLPSKFNFKSELTSSFLPKGYNYYAGGHIHTNIIKDNISYSGCLFPNNFRELIDEESTYNLCEFDFDTRELKITKKTIKTYDKEYLKIEIENKNPVEANSIINEELNKINVKGKLLLLELIGTIDGKISDIKINEIISGLYEKSVMQVLKNTYKLKSKLLDNQEFESNENIEEIEEEITKIYLRDSENFEEDYKLTKKLLNLDFSKQDEEKKSDYEKRVIEIFDKEINN